MSHFSRFCFALCLFITSIPFVHAADDPATPTPDASSTEAPPKKKSRFEGVHFIEGPTTVKLGTGSEIKVPEGFAFVGLDSLDKFLQATHDFRGKNDEGVLLSPNHWSLYFDYEDLGYVKDNDKNALDADKLYKGLVESQSESNEARKSRGWDELKIQGWATTPHYDEKTHNLTWAFKLSSSHDNYQTTWLNESIRLLGRHGVTRVTLVMEENDYQKTEKEAAGLLGGFNYLPGEKYAEFRSGDKIAEYGLAALVLGGAGAIAAKTGLLAKVGILFIKLWKLIAIGFVALGSMIGKLWRKITGREAR